jgi:hypothetical protein
MFPLWPKIIYTIFLAVLLPLYWIQYGPKNFLWFSDLALLMLGISLWLESSLLASMPALSLLLLELFWTVDFFFGLIVGKSPTNLTKQLHVRL